jgi:hypothetical protein
MKVESPDESDPEKLPAETVGLAPSGGGIRSATFCLGILQGLRAENRIREIDFLSTTSGGGYIGGFLGRLFTRRKMKEAIDPVGRVQDIVKNNAFGAASVATLYGKLQPRHRQREDARTIYAILLAELSSRFTLFSPWRQSAPSSDAPHADWIGCWVPATIHPPLVETGSKWPRSSAPGGGCRWPHCSWESCRARCHSGFHQAGHDRSAEFLSGRMLGRSPSRGWLNDGTARRISSPLWLAVSS